MALGFPSSFVLPFLGTCWNRLNFLNFFWLNLKHLHKEFLKNGLVIFLSTDLLFCAIKAKIFTPLINLHVQQLILWTFIFVVPVTLNSITSGLTCFNNGIQCLEAIMPALMASFDFAWSCPSISTLPCTLLSFLPRFLSMCCGLLSPEDDAKSTFKRLSLALFSPGDLESLSVVLEMLPRFFLLIFRVAMISH